MSVQFGLLLFTLLFIGIPAADTRAEEHEIEVDVTPRARLEQESPAALLQTEIGDSDVDLFVTGSWTTGIGIDGGFARVRPGADIPGLPTSGITSRQFPGFDTRPFRNVVDLTLTLRVDDRYFFETTFVDDFDLDQILFGYDGREEDTLESLLVGLGPISMPAYPFLPVAESAGNTLGATAALVTESTRHDLLVRYEPTALERVRYRGGRLLEEERIDPASYERNRRFLLPDGNVENLRLFREVTGSETPGSNGQIVTDENGREYVEIDLDEETTFSAARGTITLDKAATGRIVATYTVGGQAVGDEGLGADFLPKIRGDGRLTPVVDSSDLLDANRYVLSEDDTDGSEYMEAIGRTPPSAPDGGSSDSGDASNDLFFQIGGEWGVLLYEPGYFSPFARADSYATGPLAEENGQIDVRYLRQASDAEADLPRRPPARAGDDGQSLVLSGPDPRSLDSRYPFGLDSPLYGPGARRRGEESSFEIAVERAGASGAISLPGQVIPGTVVLTRNGVNETRFSVSGGGSVSLGFEPSGSDVLEFRYRTFDRGQTGGELVFASGNRFELSSADELTLALGGRWDISERGFTTEPGERDGTITLSAGYEHDGEFLDGYVRGAGRFSVADTTGARRLFGMQERSVSVGLPSYRLLPGAEPAPFEWRDAPDGIGLSGDSSDGDPLQVDTDAGRGRLLYRDFWIDGDLAPFGTSLSGDRIFDYADGELIGPYTTRESGGERAAAFEYELEENQWVAGQIQIAPDTLPEETEGVRFRWRATDPVEGDFEGGVDIYVQFGAVAEDLDGDGNLDRGASANSPDFAFNDADNGLTLRAGGIAKVGGQRATEDGSETGFLASEDPDRIASRRIASGLNADDAGGGGWPRTVEITFSERERRLIGEGRAVRLVIVEANGGGEDIVARGRVLVSSVELLGTPLLARAVEPDPDSPNDYIRVEADTAEGPAVSSGEIAERDVRLAGGSRLSASNRLAERFPDSTRFGTDDDSQRVLAVNYQALGHDGSGNENRRIELRGATSPALFRDYEYFIAYIHTGDAAGDDENPDELMLDLDYGDGERSGIRARAIPVPHSGQWQELRIGLSDGAVEVDGERVADRADINAGVEGRQISLRVRPSSGTGDDEYRFYLDEIHLAGARPGITATLEAGARYRREGEIARIGDSLTLSDLDTRVAAALDADLTAETISRIAADLDAAVNVGRVRVAAAIGADYSPVFDELTTSAEHRVRGPTEAAPLSFDERYGRDFGAPGGGSESRLTAFALRTDPVAADARAEASYTRRRLRQRWLVDTGVNAQNINLSLDFTQTHDTYAPPDAGYFESWVRSYSLLAAHEPADALERRATMQLARSASDARLSATGRAELRFATTPGAGEQRSEALGEIGVRWRPAAARSGSGDDAPVQAPDESTDTEEQPGGSAGVSPGAGRETLAPGTPLFMNLTVEPFYRRTLRVREEADSGAWGSDFQRLGNALSQESYIYDSPPFAELFQSAEESAFGRIDAGRDLAEYRPSVGLRARRSFGSRIRDLVVPYRLEADFGRRYERREDALRARSDLSASVSTFAVNLFGRLGSYSLTELYASDEFFGRLTAQALFGVTNEYRFGHEVAFRFFGTSDRSLEVENSLSAQFTSERDWDNEVSLRYVWDTPARFAESIPWPVDYERARIVHSEEAALETSRTTRTNALERTRLTVGHSSTLELDNTVNISALARTGWEQETVDGTPLVDFFGFQAELEATFRF